MRNQYIKRPVELDEVVAHVNVGDPDKIEKLFLSVSPCRSGTTVLLRVFGAAGIQAHYQELKNVLRWRMQDEPWSWQVPQDLGRPLYLKETLGPYTELEALFNPLEVLLEAGMPREKIHLFVAGRAPLNTWASWNRWWGEWTSLDKFELAYQTTEDVRKMAVDEGIASSVFVYEAIRDHGAEAAVQALFRKLGIPFTPRSVKGWLALPPFGEKGSNVIMPYEPPVFDVPNLHDQVEAANALGFYAKNSVDRLNLEDVRYIQQSTIPGIYEKWRQDASQDLVLTIAEEMSFT